MNKEDKECILRALMSYRRDLFQFLQKYKPSREVDKSEFFHVDMLYKEIYREIYPETRKNDLTKSIIKLED